MIDNLWDALNSKEKEKIKIKKYKRNEIVFNENDLCTSFALILKGEVSISTYTLLEKEYNIKIIGENESFGEYLLFSDSPYYLGNVIALKESQIAFIPKNYLLHLLQTNINFLNCYMNKAANNTMKLQNRLKVLSQSSIREKILFYLKNETHNKNTNIIYIKSKENLAKILNIPRPSLSRELILLKKDGIIDYDLKKIIIK